MTADGSSSWRCKFTALLLAVALHGVVFYLADFNVDTPSLAQPKTTRVLIFPVVPIEVAETVPEIEIPHPAVEPLPEPELIEQEEPSPVEISKPELEPEPEPEPEPPPEMEPKPEPEPEPEPPPEVEPEPIPTPELPPIPEPEPPPPVEEPPVAVEAKTPSIPPDSVPVEVARVDSPEFSEPPAEKANDDSDGSFDVAPWPRRSIKPKYPILARQEEWEGRVICEVVISKRGSVLTSAVVKSSGHNVLDAAALKAVNVARFAPALRCGHAVEVRVRLTVDFRLDER